MKQPLTKNVKAPAKSKLKKVISFFLIAVGGVLVFIVLIIAIISIRAAMLKHEHEIFFQKVAGEIRLPSNYLLVNTTFHDLLCLDVCASMTLHYKSKDGSPLDRMVVKKSLENVGYEYLDESDYNYMPGTETAVKTFKIETRNGFTLDTVKIVQLRGPITELKLKLE